MTSMQWGAPAEFPAVYEELAVPGFFTVFADDLLDRVRPSAGERMLDVATGTGIVPRRARERCPDLARLVGLDLTPGMLAEARKKGDGVEFVEGSAGELPFEDDAFDIVTCQQGFQFFPEREQALGGYGRVLAGDGRVAVPSGVGTDAHPAPRAVTEAVRARVP